MSAAPVETPEPDEQAAALAALDALGPAETPDAQPVTPPRRRSRSGTSGAERARRAKASTPAGDKPKAARPARRAAAPKIGEGMAQLYAMTGVAVSMVPTGPAVAGPGAVAGQTISGVVGMSLVANSAAIGAAWEQAAKDDPRIRAALERVLTVSTVGQIVAAHVPVLLAGLVAAGAAPAALVGEAPDAAG